MDRDAEAGRGTLESAVGLSPDNAAHKAECVRADLRNAHDAILCSCDLIIVVNFESVARAQAAKQKSAGCVTKNLHRLFLAEFNPSA
jgi:hypothetical protein